MRRSLISLLFLLLGSSAFSQSINCTIYPGDTTVCYASNIILYAEYVPGQHYYWHNSGETTQSIEVVVRDTTKYYLTVYNQDSTEQCTDSITISTYPRMLVAFEQINKGCPGECKSQVIATASEGFPPYRYLWYADVAPNDSSYALGLCSEDQYKLTVYDTICSFDTSYTVDAYHLPEIEVNIIPDTLYTTNPVASLNFDNKSSDSIQLTNWVWKFTDGTSTNDMNPSHVFPDSDTVTFIYTTTDGCTDSIKTNVEVKVFELEIPNVFTPNGDGTNETWDIPNLDRYIDNDLIVFNRWGQKVFNSGDYKGDWDGGKLPDGVYFYILRCYGYWKEDVFRGAVSIVGSRY